MKTNFLFLTAIIAAMFAVSCSDDTTLTLAVRLDQSQVELVKGQSVQLKASVTPNQSADFTWFSQDENYVTVDQTGLVTAVGLKKDDVGQVVPVSVYAKFRGGAGECKVTVLPLETKKVEIVSEEEQIKLDPAAKKQLVAKCYPEDADLTDITWSVDRASVATIDSKTGELTGVSTGIATVRASYSDNVYDEIKVLVNNVAVKSVKIVPAEIDVPLGSKTVRLKAELEPVNASANLVWTSFNPDVASIDAETGIITAKSVGTTDVQVLVQPEGCTAKCTVNVVAE